MLDLLWGIGGMIVIIAIALLFSVDRRKIRFRTVALALGLQVGFGVLVLYVPAGRAALETVTLGVQAVINSSGAGIDFLFGPVLPEEGSVFAFQVLPVIVFFAALTSVLYHLGVLQWVVKIIGGGLAKLLGTSTPESMNAAANIFVGQTEAPLVIRPYVAAMSRSELFAVMCGGLATVAGSVLVGYSLLGAPLEYLIAASFMAAPAALLMAKLLVPSGALEDAPALADGADDDGARPGAGGPAQEDEERTGRRGVRQWLAGGARRGATSYAALELTRRPDAPAPERTDAGHGGAGSSAARPGDADGVAGTAGTGRPGDADGPAGTGAPGDAARTPDSEPVSVTDAAGDAAGEDDEPANVIDAAARGASDGLSLALNVGAMLIAFISLIALVNVVLGAVGGLFGLEALTLEQLFGYVFAPVMFAVGVPWSEALDAGSFLGQKLVLNEFVAFADFAPQIGDYSPKTQAIVTFALTGFANFGSLAILLGGLGGIAPSRRADIARLGLLSVLGGTLANLMSATIAGMLIG
ncbi:NupC/NupG family nucleoside CNT transporter [Kocuria sp. LUK]|uniref:NupC/NupG family nucleoside CNT transporter n=1 Tax=Kocuria sp. LUK TaxID=2897828 RepID=UPI001E4EA26A|nr:nucleoside transporter C-terminal domain-containing protein [Kocuria sp. LUK]MCD1144259.1 NupC/NupG family nucleoside CNT transporter [Kocuria sp. LUK]